jgi:SAM-dependent methyltransferase
MLNWNSRYSEPGFAYGTEPNDFLSAQLAELPRGKTLCVAEGEGRNAVFLARHGHEVIAVDSSSVAMLKAGKLAKDSGVNITTITCDLAEFSIEVESLDAVISIFCHLPPAMRRALHSRIVAGLKPGGALLLEAYTPAQLAHGTGGPADASMTMTLQQLEHELQGLDFEIARELERDVIEGKYHTGTGAVVQVLARKPEEATTPYIPYL